MLSPKHIVIVAGEASGDAHAASFVRQLKPKHPELVFSGIGGQQMHHAGVELISDLARYGVAGISEVFQHFRTIRTAYQAIKKHLTTVKPDLLILVDYPGFNLRLAQFAKKKLGLRILYYISPQIWAWKASRIETIRACVDHMAVIFPFEKTLYLQHNIPVSFVGHPLTQVTPTHLDTRSARTQLNLPQHQRIIAMLPGSRTHEIDTLMPVLCDTAHQLQQQDNSIHIVIPVASSISTEHIQSHLRHATFEYTLINGQAKTVVQASDCAVVASGTASLECALLEKPMCIIYKASRLTYFIGAIFVKIRYLGLCNILSNQMIVPELLQYDCCASELTPLLLNLLHHDTTSMIRRLKTMKKTLSSDSADCSISELIESILAEIKSKSADNHFLSRPYDDISLTPGSDKQSLAQSNSSTQ